LLWVGLSGNSWCDVISGEFNVCICSDVLSRGINIETITTVVNMDLPEGRESGGGADAVHVACAHVVVPVHAWHLCLCMSHNAQK